MFEGGPTELHLDLVDLAVARGEVTREQLAGATSTVDASGLDFGSLTHVADDRWTYAVDSGPPAIDQTDPDDRLDERARVTWTNVDGTPVAYLNLRFEYLRPWPHLRAADDELWVYRKFKDPRMGDAIKFHARLGRNDHFGPPEYDEFPPHVYVWDSSPEDGPTTLWSTARFPDLVVGDAMNVGTGRFRYQDLGLGYNDLRYDAPGQPLTMGGSRSTGLTIYPITSQNADVRLAYEMCPPFPIPRACSAASLTVHVRKRVEAVADWHQVAPGQSADIDLLSNDQFTDTPDRTATVTVSGLPDDLAATVGSDRRLHFSAPASRAGTGLPFVVEVRDFSGKSRATGWLQIGDPQAPQARDDRAVAGMGVAVTVDVLANDVHSALESVRARSSRLARVEVQDDGSLHIMLTRAAAGRKSVRVPYTITDGTRLTDDGAVTLKVRRR
jgi:hypothetical protein